MVFVKVRETYDLHTQTNKMSIIGIHTPDSSIIKKQYPGLLMQCKAYRPVSVNIACACASMLPADPLQVGTAEGDVAPEDLFNPILYKTLSNKGMSQIESYIARGAVGTTVDGPSLKGDYTGIQTDDFNLYYGLLSDTHSWRHANPQQGFTMSGVRPLVYEVLQTIGDTNADLATDDCAFCGRDGNVANLNVTQFRGSSKPMPFLNCTAYTYDSTTPTTTSAAPGFPGLGSGVGNAMVDVPSPVIYCAAVIVPPSRLHQLFYRMVVEWTIEFSAIRSITEIANWNGVANIGVATHYQSYSYGSAKAALVGDTEKDMLVEDTAMVSTSEGLELKKVM